MASFSPDQQFNDLIHDLGHTLQDVFPFEGKKTQITLHGLEADNSKTSDDLRGQQAAIRQGKSWTVPVYADLEMKRDGKTLDRRKVKIMDVPRTTDRYGYIVGGNEYQILNQFRLKSGVYHRIAPNGAAEASFNLANSDQFANGQSIKLILDPESGVFFLQHRNSKVPAYHIMRELGASDSELERTWGKEVFEKNKGKTNRDSALRKLVEMMTGAKPKSLSEEQIKLIHDNFQKTRLLEETTAVTLGKAATTVNADVLTRSSGKLLKLNKGEAEDDDKNDLQFQSMHTAGDLIAGQVKREAWRIKNAVNANIDRKKNLRGVLPNDLFNKSVRKFFQSSLVAQGEQTNPLEMVAGARRTTIMGEQGGIQSAHVVKDEAKLINQSHLGFLDPIHTPEGEKTGVTLSLPLAAGKRGNDITSTFYSPKSRKLVSHTAREVSGQVVAFPDEYVRRGKDLVPASKKIRATRDGEMLLVDPKEVDLVLPSARGLFGVGSNLVPFLNSNQGNRAMTAARQQEQAVPLLAREVPLVQVKTDGEATFEKIIGGAASKYSPTDGVIKEVKDDAVVVRGRDGKDHEVQVYRNFALAGGTVYDSEVRVKPGQAVKRGQLLADTNYTKDGTLALGTNLKAAYIPYFGYNFEDGIVISESAAQKLTSMHAHQKDIMVDESHQVGRKKFFSQFSHVYNRDQVENIGEDGVVRVGARIKPGDPLVLALRKPEQTAVTRDLASFRRGGPPRWRDASETWSKDNPGVVTDVIKKDGMIRVVVRTEEAAQIGDKLVGRHGNKGVITRIVPDHEMPYRLNAKGEKEAIQIALNPLGIPGRINLGQVLETAVSKVAEKEGKPIEVRNFERGVDNLKRVQGALRKAGLEDKEVVYDANGKPLEQKVLVGNQYIFKLKHQAEKKMGARSAWGGGPMPYDVNNAPGGGSPHGGMSMGELGLYSMLAHGARENLFDMYAYKTNKNPALWDALREGTPLPPPATPFAYNKLMGYMNGMRVNVRKEGNTLQLVPFTEEQVKALSNGEIKEPGLVVRGKDAQELPGGLFDPKVTGGLRGKKWAHFSLPEPMPNPLFEEAIKKVLDINQKTFDAYVSGEKSYKGKSGGAALEALLKDVDPVEEERDIRNKLKTAKGQGRNKLYKKLRIVQALNKEKLDPSVYMMRSVPVLPPEFRPLSLKDNGDISTEDINGLYKDLGSVIEAYGKLKSAGGSDTQLAEQRVAMYDGLKAMTGTGGSLTREYRGILDFVSGKTRTGDKTRGASKTGFFQKQVMKRRQDFSGRSIIIPEPKQSIDELGVPEEMAWTMYDPFVQRELRRYGFSPLAAKDEVAKRTPAARKALGAAVDKRPILLKRDPSLHKHNVMAFKPRLVSGKAIEIHPLVTSGYNADFDGDAMSVYVPLSDKAVKESYGMFPSNNLFSATTAGLMYVPGHEALLGDYLLTQPGKKTDFSFRTLEEAKAAGRTGRIKKNDVIKVEGHETTLGRMLLEEVLPPRLRETGKKKLSEMSPYDKKTVGKILTSVAKNEPDKFDVVANRFKDLGNDYSTELGYSVGLDDFAPINTKQRDRYAREADKIVAKVSADKKLTEKQKNEKIVKALMALDDRLDKGNTDALKKKPTNIYTMVVSGSRGKPEQLKQIVSTPGLVQDAKGRTVPYFIPRSYSEGMDTASYWTTLHGARKGTIQKTQGVRDPGAVSKLVINSTLNQLITEDDCGTTDGVRLPASDPDVLDRFLAHSVKFGGHSYSAGTLVTPDMQAAAAKAGGATVLVRSPLRCKATHGICKKCMGLNENGQRFSVGDNVGVIAGQSIGEPSTQLSLNVFHTGGLAKGSGARSLGTFKDMERVLKLPHELPNEAPLARLGGKVTRIESAAQGGHYVHIGSTKHYVPAHLTMSVKVGATVHPGDPLTSDGMINARQLLPLKGVDATQDFLTDSLREVLREAAPVRRRNLEVIVKAMTNVTQIDDPGGHPDWDPGDLVPTSEVTYWNKHRKKGQAPAKFTPMVKGVNVLPLEMGEDWVARLNFQSLGRTLAEASREGWKSNIHGFHPVPGLAHAAEFGRGKEKLGPNWRGEY